MWTPNPVLDEEELELLGNAPEECLRRAIRRGAFSLEEISAGLSPRMAAIVRSIATGERLDAAGDSLEEWGVSRDPVLPLTPEQHDVWVEEARTMLSSHPELTHLLDEQILSPFEAQGAAHAIDRILGRYLTGTRYAAP